MPHLAPSRDIAPAAFASAPAASGPLADLGVPAPGAVTLVLDHASAAAGLVGDLLVEHAAAGRVSVVVDGGGRFRAYDLVRAAQRAAVLPEVALASVRVARAFTAYQLQALVEDELPREVARAATFATERTESGEGPGLSAPSVSPVSVSSVANVRAATFAPERTESAEGPPSAPSVSPLSVSSVANVRAARLGLVAVLGFPELYMDEDVPRPESFTLARRALAAARGLAVTATAPVLVTAAAGARGMSFAAEKVSGRRVVRQTGARWPDLRALLEEAADEVAVLRPVGAARGTARRRRGARADDAGVRVALPRRGAEALLAPPRQRRLSEYGDATWDEPNRRSGSRWTSSSRSGATTDAGSRAATPRPSTPSSAAPAPTRARA